MRAKRPKNLCLIGLNRKFGLICLRTIAARRHVGGTGANLVVLSEMTQSKGSVGLTGLIAAGALGGLLAGWFVGEPMASWAWIGELFLNALKMVIVPLVMASMITGVGRCRTTVNVWGDSVGAAVVEKRAFSRTR